MPPKTALYRNNSPYIWSHGVSVICRRTCVCESMSFKLPAPSFSHTLPSSHFSGHHSAFSLLKLNCLRIMFYCLSAKCARGWGEGEGGAEAKIHYGMGMHGEYERRIKHPLSFCFTILLCIHPSCPEGCDYYR